MTSEKEKAELGAATLGAFLNQIGSPNDAYKSLVVEVLLEELMNAKVISILRKSEQERDKDNSDHARGVDSDIPADGPQSPEPPANLAGPNSEAHLRSPDAV